jgi:hypothetical protein
LKQQHREQQHRAQHVEKYKANYVNRSRHFALGIDAKEAIEHPLDGAQCLIEESGFALENPGKVAPDRFDQADDKREKNYVFQPAHYRDSDPDPEEF